MMKMLLREMLTPLLVPVHPGWIRALAKMAKDREEKDKVEQRVVQVGEEEEHLDPKFLPRLREDLMLLRMDPVKALEDLMELQVLDP
jgi:hypothetical protein